jgi:hypothetical protein
MRGGSTILVRVEVRRNPLHVSDGDAKLVVELLPPAPELACESLKNFHHRRC